MEFKFGDIFYVYYPYEDDSSNGSDRPAIFIKKHDLEENIHALMFKITTKLKHLGKDKYKLDFLIKKWEEASLDEPSLAQVSKPALVPIDELTQKIGSLVDEDIEMLKKAIIEDIKKSKEK